MVKFPAISRLIVKDVYGSTTWRAPKGPRMGKVVYYLTAEPL